MKVTSELEGIAKDFASPVILRILRKFSNKDIAKAVKEDLDIVEGLKKNHAVLSRLRLIFMPFTSYLTQVAPYIRSEKWLRWFINNELKHSRPDLHVQFIYDREAFNWMHRNMVKLSEFLFE